jgi:ribosomal protein S27AE
MALKISLMVLIGIGGIAVLTLAWIRPMPLSDRILTTVVGAIGPVWVLIRLLLLRFMPSRRSVSKLGVGNSSCTIASANQRPKLKRCPRCGGSMFLTNDIYGWYEWCLQCSYTNELKSVVETKG